MANRFISIFKNAEFDKASKQAFNFLITDLLVNNLTGEQKQRELTANNMESFAPTNFIPTMFYIFMYVKPDMERVGDLSFYDNCPLILCTNVDKDYIMGLNFNYIPNNVRATVLDILINDFDEFYNDFEIYDDFKINEKLGSVLISEKGLSDVLQYLKEKAHIDISMCLRKYNRKNIVKSRMIEYDEWKYIPFLSFNDAVRGINLAKVQADLVMNKSDK